MLRLVPLCSAEIGAGIHHIQPKGRWRPTQHHTPHTSHDCLTVQSPTQADQEAWLPTRATCSTAIVTTRFLGFHRVWQGSGSVFDSIDLYLPDVSFETEAAYIRVPLHVRTAVQAAGLPFRDGLHAAAHAMLNVLPLFLPCEAVDVTTECDNPYRTTYRPERLLIYDRHPGGIGLAARVRSFFVFSFASPHDNGVLLSTIYEIHGLRMIRCVLLCMATLLVCVQLLQ